MNTSRGSHTPLFFPSSFLLSELYEAHRGECRLIDSRCNRQTIVSLESCDRLSGHWPKNTIDRSVVVTGRRQLFLNINGHLVRRQSIVAVDRAVVCVSHGRRITPCREPVTRVPIPPAAVHEDDPSVVASPPTPIVPLPVVIAEGRIPLAAERVATPVISNSHIAATIKRGVLCAVDRNVSIPIDRYIIAIANLIRVASTINLGVPCPVHRDVSFTVRVGISRPIDREVSLTINRYVVPSTRLVCIAITINIVSRPGNRDIPVAINRSVTSRTKLLFPLGVPLTHPFVPREVSFANRAQAGVVFDHGI